MRPAVLGTLLGYRLLRRVCPPFKPRLSRRVRRRLLRRVRPFSQNVFQEFETLIDGVRGAMRTDTLVISSKTSAFSIRVPGVDGDRRGTDKNGGGAIFNGVFKQFGSPLTGALRSVPR